MVADLRVFKPVHMRFKHAFCFTTTIFDGVSENAYRSLNLATHVGDDLEHVSVNRQRLNAYVDASLRHKSLQRSAIKWLHQTHSTEVFDYDDIGLQACDGCYTDSILTPVVVMTADCLPIVFHCAKSGRVAAVHAGWRGLMDGIIENTLKLFQQTCDLSVWIGPSINQTAFEVSNDIITQFSDYEVCIAESMNGKFNIDLPRIAQIKLQSAGVSGIEISPDCTYQNSACFSHRRAHHNGLQNTGRMATVIIRTQ